eukprot:2030377-Rhodomonas_salina.1
MSAFPSALPIRPIRRVRHWHRVSCSRFSPAPRIASPVQTCRIGLVLLAIPYASCTLCAVLT